MQPEIITTPFGRRSLTLAHVAAQAAARARAPEARVHKWEVFRALCAARERLGLSERALAVLDALLSFHPETVLSGDGLVVFPSNAQLSLRAHGMPASTLRRHLAALIDAGVVIRRDSPNGKRYARKGGDGEIAFAFGFDLGPLVARAAEFEALAQEVRAHDRALRYARERLTLLRRDLAKMIMTAIEEGAPPPESFKTTGWIGLQTQYRALLLGLPRQADLESLEAATSALAELARLASIALEAFAKIDNLSANESPAERHIQNSNSETTIESEEAFKEEQAREAGEKPKTVVPSLSMVLRACPDIADYARNGVAHWRDFFAAASIARAALGVSPSAWEAARTTLGDPTAAAALAAILQRGEAVASPGGYLRALTRKAQQNAFSVTPMLNALLAARNRERDRGGDCPTRAPARE